MRVDIFVGPNLKILEGKGKEWVTLEVFSYVPTRDVMLMHELKALCQKSQALLDQHLPATMTSTY